MPPEPRFEKLDHRGLIDQAAVNMPPQDLDAPIARDDGSVYNPLHDPTSSVHGWSPPSPPAPTEAELRVKLAEAIEVQAQLDEALGSAQAASDRAEEHRRRSEAELHDFDGLDEMVAQDTIAQLVGDTVRVELNGALADRITARERARISYAGAVRAAESLNRDLAKAKGRSAEAGASVERLICGILVHEAQRIAEQHADLLKQATAIAVQLLGFNLYSANRGVVLPPPVREVLSTYDVGQLMRQYDKSLWLAAADVLRSDPQAEVRIRA